MEIFAGRTQLNGVLPAYCLPWNKHATRGIIPQRRVTYVQVSKPNNTAGHNLYTCTFQHGGGVVKFTMFLFPFPLSPFRFNTPKLFFLSLQRLVGAHEFSKNKTRGTLVNLGREKDSSFTSKSCHVLAVSREFD